MSEPPSEPRNVRIISTTSSSITLTWDPPASLGGRSDLSYILWYQEDGNEMLVNGGSTDGNTTMGTISGIINSTK